MPSITFTVSAADATRVTNAATSLGFADPKSMIVQYVKDVVSTFEQQQQVSALVPPTPISPT